MKYIPGCLSCTKWLVETFWHFLNTSCPGAQISSWICVEKGVNTNPACLSVRDFIGWMPWREAKVSLNFHSSQRRCHLSADHAGSRDVWTCSVPALLCWFAAHLATGGAQVHSNRLQPELSKTHPCLSQQKTEHHDREINTNKAKESVSRLPFIKCSFCRQFS